VFGNYIDIYDMTQAVEDGATVPVYYESRLIKLNLDDETLRLLDQEYENLADEGAEEEDIKRSKQENAQLHALLRAPETVDTLCRDIIEHYETNRRDHLTGKAMIVALDRATGIAIYKRLIELRPDWKDMIGVVMTQGNQDPAEWNDIIGSPAHKQELARQFKDNNSAMKIAIVVDMWLTGFDVPSLATMYVYKPMKGHNLMQAIARVNRVFPEKSGGLVVDYIGIAQALKKAMHDYTNRDKKRFGDPDIKKTAYQEFLSALQRCRDCMNGYDYSAFATCSNLQRANLIRGGVNVLLDPNNIVSVQCEDNVTKYDSAQKVFLEESKRLAQATTLCRSLLSPAEKFEEAYFEAVRTLLVRLTSNKKITRKLIDERITALLKVAVKADGVVEILNTKETEFNLFDEEFLKEVSAMKEKNFALELLKRLLEQHIRQHAKKNMTQSEKFSEMLDARLAEYLRGLISNEEVIQELLKMARELKAHAEQASEFGLTDEEQAFYDALIRPQAVKDFYENDTLVAMAKELTEALRNSKTIDWRQKESARANMRRMVKRLLKKYKYPPEEQENALDTVIRQCELYADSDTNEI
jgi:type I restriction enzyme R subunit